MGVAHVGRDRREFRPARRQAGLDASGTALGVSVPTSGGDDQMTATIRPDSVTIETTVMAADPVPVSFGFHPYFGIPRLPRAQWRLELPALRKFILDDRGIPTELLSVFPFRHQV